MLEFLENTARKVRKALEAAAQQPGGPGMGDEVEMGADGTPTKHIDKLAEDVVIRELEKHNASEAARKYGIHVTTLYRHKPYIEWRKLQKGNKP